MKRNVIMDVSNLFYSVFHAYSKENDDILLAMANKSFMDTINKRYRENNCDEVILAFDGSKNWRKLYTSKDFAITHKRYKGQRRKNLTDSERQKLERFDSHVVEFREMLKAYTGLLVLHHDRLEADDLIAGYIDAHQDESHVIISRDRDYLQLLRYDNVSIIDPSNGKKLTLSEYDHDPDLFMFTKCIRGDASDNVISAYPRLYTTKLREAYVDDYAKNNIMQHEYTVEYIDSVSGAVLTRDYKTSEVFEENEMLMDLTKQPDVIREIIEKAIKDCKASRGTYHMIKFLRFCSKMDFQHIIHSINNYNKLLKGPAMRFRDQGEG
jgi:5'-3' exonuclease